MMVEETQYDDGIECHHSYDKRCHTTYTTDYEPQQVNLYNKRVRPTKNESQQQGIYYLEREREGERERGAGGQVSRQAYLR
jgi:hypothetical protein